MFSWNIRMLTNPEDDCNDDIMSIFSISSTVIICTLVYPFVYVYMDLNMRNNTRVIKSMLMFCWFLIVVSFIMTLIISIEKLIKK